MLDTNILLSAVLFPGQTLNTMMDIVTKEHQLVLSSFIINELLDTPEILTATDFINKYRPKD